MNQIIPYNYLNGVPCSIVAVSCALGALKEPKDIPDLKEDGYATLTSANKYIRANLDVKKRQDYKRGERPRLKDLHINGRAIICVLGHFLYLDHEDYWSFFDNEDDSVVAVWLLK